MHTTTESIIRYQLYLVNRKLHTGTLTERQTANLLRRRENLMSMLRGV